MADESFGFSVIFALDKVTNSDNGRYLELNIIRPSYLGEK